jgi:DNA-directed RNA polymerase specialized sigma24 family protein
MDHARPTDADDRDGRAGREQLAHFLLEHEAALRRRIGAEVRGSPGVDADDVFSTMLRRVDYAAAKGSFTMRSGAETWGFVAQVVKRAVARHRQRATRLAATIARVAAEAEPWAEPPPPDERAELVAILSELDRTRPQDAELVRHRLRGRKWRELSDAMGVSEEALRQRWSALMSRLRERCAAAVPPTSRSVTSRRR